MLEHEAEEELIVRFILRVLDQLGVADEPLRVSDVPFSAHLIDQVGYLDEALGFRVVTKYVSYATQQNVCKRLRDMSTTDYQIVSKYGDGCGRVLFDVFILE